VDEILLTDKDKKEILSCSLVELFEYFFPGSWKNILLMQQKSMDLKYVTKILMHFLEFLFIPLSIEDHHKGIIGHLIHFWDLILL